MPNFTAEEVYTKCLEYFNGDALAADVINKYLLRDKDGNFKESHPEDIWQRLSKNLPELKKNIPIP